MTLPDAEALPSSVTFQDMARLLREHDLDSHATADNVRYRARTDPKWPVGYPGEGKAYEYGQVSNARTMPPLPIMQHYLEKPVVGRRGPDKKPRKRRGSK